MTPASRPRTNQMKNLKTPHGILQVPTTFVTKVGADRNVKFNKKEAAEIAKLAADILAHVEDYPDMHTTFWAMQAATEWLTAIVMKSMADEAVGE